MISYQHGFNSSQDGDHTLASFPEHIPLILEFADMD